MQNQIRYVENFNDLVSTALYGHMNAICWQRELKGNFEELVNKIELNENLVQLDIEHILKLQLSEQGELARQIVVEDFNLLKAHGAAPVLNIIKYYERDEHTFFPTDVYSFHVDRAPIPSSTFLCTYYGEPSEILPNAQAEQKIGIPEIRNELKKQFKGKEDHFDLYLSEHFYDLHYQAKANANIMSLGTGHLWRLAVDCYEWNVLPCIHRAPLEKNGQSRLLLIC